MKGILTPLLILVVLLAVGGFLLMSGKVSLPFASVPYSEISSCRYGEPEYFSLRCEAVGNAIPWENFSSVTGTPITVNTVETTIQSVRVVSGSGDYVILDPNGLTLCKGGQIATTGNGCDGKSLSTGYTYSFKTTQCGLFGCSIKATISGRSLMLNLYKTQVGVFGATIPGSTNCIIQDLAMSLLQTQYGSQISDDVRGQVALTQGQTYTQISGYREIPPISPINYNGNAAYCDQANKKIYGFTKDNSLTGSCWAIQDRGNVLYDGSNQLFCCADSACGLYGLGTDYKCVSNTCQKAAVGTVQCRFDTDCQGVIQTDFVDNPDGTTSLVSGSCVNSQCVTKATPVGCNPERTYSNNQCCKKDMFGNYNLEQCISPLKSCDTHGAEACCLDTQSQYTFKAPPSGQYCCDKNNDGIGFVTSSQATCFEEGGGGGGLFGWLGGLFGGIGAFFGGIFNAFILIAIIVIVILVLLIVRSIL